MNFWVLFSTGVILGIVVLLIIFSLKNKKRERRWSREVPKVITYMGVKTKKSFKEEK